MIHAVYSPLGTVQSDDPSTFETESTATLFCLAYIFYNNFFRLGDDVRNYFTTIESQQVVNKCIPDHLPISSGDTVLSAVSCLGEDGEKRPVLS